MAITMAYIGSLKLLEAWGQASPYFRWNFKLLNGVLIKMV